MAQRTASYTSGVVGGTYVRPTTTLKSDGIVTAIADNTRVACILSNCVTVPTNNDVVWGTKLYDPLNMSNVGNTIITVPLAGVYFVTFNFFLNENPLNRARSASVKFGNGTFEFAGFMSAELQPPGDNLWSLSSCTVILCAAGDQISIRNSAGCVVDPDTNSSFSVQRL